MKLSLFWIDAFTDKVFRGNPAVVIPLDHWLRDDQMQSIARENGVSETAFFVRNGERFYLRWFTPKVEVDLCGHATLASAHVLFRELHYPTDTITFDSRSGPLLITRGDDGKLELDFPSRPAVPCDPPEALLAGLRVRPQHVARSERMWLCVYNHASDVLALTSGHPALATLDPGRIIVTAPGADCDFVSRFFAPDAGIAEDPVTGSAHCTLMPYWAQRLGRDRLHARQVSARGGELWCELIRGSHPKESGDRVKIAGDAVLYLRGELDFW